MKSSFVFNGPDDWYMYSKDSEQNDTVEDRVYNVLVVWSIRQGKINCKKYMEHLHRKIQRLFIII